MLVLHGKTLTDTQGLNTCSISAHAVRVWTTDTGEFIQTATLIANGVGDDLLKGICGTLNVPILPRKAI